MWLDFFFFFSNFPSDFIFKYTFFKKKKKTHKKKPIHFLWRWQIDFLCIEVFAPGEKEKKSSWSKIQMTVVYLGQWAAWLWNLRAVSASIVYLIVYFILCHILEGSRWPYLGTYHRQKTFDFSIYGFSSVQSLSHVRLFATPWIVARQASLSITNSRSSPRLTSIESVMPSSHLILCLQRMRSMDLCTSKSTTKTTEWHLVLP